MSKTSAGTRADRIATEIADAILAGEFAPGERLDEQRLAETYEVSRTPVREALRRLVSSGLIELRPRRGAVVTETTGENLNGLFIAMAEIEATCARLCAISMSPLERRALGALHERMGEIAAKGSRAGYSDANHQFHTMLYAGAHNPVLEEFALQLRRRLDHFRRAQFRAPRRLAQSHAEHGEVVRAILSGDAPKAHSAMLHHVTLVEIAVDKVATGLSRGRNAGR
ncbi:MAG: GntR family transcriptional regulator [Beijerinckiaceae bacterium]